MEGIIRVVEVLLVISFLAFAVWMIGTRKSMKGSVVTALIFFVAAFFLYYYLRKIAFVGAVAVIVLLVLWVISVLAGG